MAVHLGKMCMCADCKSIFGESEIKRVRHSDGDAWDECPNCGSDQIDDVEECYLCGEWHKPDELHNEVCDDCIAMEASNVWQMLEYSRCYCTAEEVLVSPLFLKAFTPSQINDLLESAFTQLSEAEQKKACEQLATDDPYHFSEYLKGEA